MVIFWANVQDIFEQMEDGTGHCIEHEHVLKQKII